MTSWMVLLLLFGLLPNLLDKHEVLGCVLHVLALHEKNAAPIFIQMEPAH